MTTITDIAKALDISAATVSRAMNNSRLVGPELTARIREKGEELGFRKRVIRRHRGRAILSIKLVLPHHEEPERALFYDLASLIEGIRVGFSECAINLLCETASPKFKPFPHKKGGDTSGFIFAFNHPSEIVRKELDEIGTPYIILNRRIEGLPCVASENAKGMTDIAAHLSERNPSLKPAFVTLDGMGQIGEERLEGFAEACRSLGVPFDAEKDSFTFGGISSITGELVKKIAAHHNALVCVNDILGTVVLTELDRLGIDIPSQVAVTGFDDSPVRRLSRPLLTTVSMPLAELAAAAAASLEKHIIERVPSDEIIHIPGKLLVGESS
jgi:LacI family transcriptional regulator